MPGQFIHPYNKTVTIRQVADWLKDNYPEVPTWRFVEDMQDISK